MNHEIVKKWIKKANNDLKIGIDELNVDEPATDAICFHMQQCVEKYLKAFLIFHNKEIRKTHDISILIKQCIEIDEEFKILYDLEVDALTDYAVEIRYPDDFYFPTVEETKEAIELAMKVKELVLSKIKI